MRYLSSIEENKIIKVETYKALEDVEKTILENNDRFYNETIRIRG